MRGAAPARLIRVVLALYGRVSVIATVRPRPLTRGCSRWARRAYPARVARDMDGRSSLAPPGAEAGCCPVSSPDPRIARRFDHKAGAWTDADELPPMVDVSARLLDLLREASLRRPTVLELGCGTGGLMVALLEMGASRATGIDLSAASLAVAGRRARQAGYDDLATFSIGDASRADAEPHDWVVLDRVICCFVDVERLVRKAVDLARERIAISVPESRGWRGLINRPKWALEDVWDLVNGRCRGYVHDLRRIERTLADAGFVRTTSSRVGLWHIGVYDRMSVKSRSKRG